MSLTTKPDEVNTPKKSHEKAQHSEEAGPIHAPPKVEALGGSSESQTGPNLSSGRYDAELLAWSNATSLEQQRGRELDAACVAKAPPEEIEAAEKRWHASLQNLAATYDALPTKGELDLTMRLVEVLTPEPKQPAPAALGRALLGVQIETQRRMVRWFRPAECARSAERALVVWSIWREAEMAYSRVRGTRDLAKREMLHTEAHHFRRLMREVSFLVAWNEELRVLRRLVRLHPSDVVRELWQLDEPAQERRAWEKFPELRDASMRRRDAEAMRETPFAMYCPPGQLLLLDAERAEEDTETNHDPDWEGRAL